MLLRTHSVACLHLRKKVTNIKMRAHLRGVQLTFSLTPPLLLLLLLLLREALLLVPPSWPNTHRARDGSARVAAQGAPRPAAQRGEAPQALVLQPRHWQGAHAASAAARGCTLRVKSRPRSLASRAACSTARRIDVDEARRETAGLTSRYGPSGHDRGVPHQPVEPSEARVAL